MKQLNYFLKDEAATLAIGANLAKVLHGLSKPQSFVVYLNGDLGAGKTTLTRGFVRGMGHEGNVKSPTYTLVEPYELAKWRVFHFDLYRLSDPEELEYMGIRDYFNDDCCCFIEWPKKGVGLLAKADLIIDIAYQNDQRTINLKAETVHGETILLALTSEVANSL